MRRFAFSFRISDPGLVPIWSLVSICVAIESLLILGDLGLLGGVRIRQTVYEYGAFWPGLWRDWRANYNAQPITMLVSYAFLHGSLLHLALNMVTLVSLGRGVVERIGAGRFILLYAISAMGGAAAYALLSSRGTPMVGASGALFGLAGAILAWVWDDAETIWASFSSVWRMLLLLIAINVVMYWGLDGRLAWETHLGGFLAGWVAAIALDRRSA